MSTKFHSIEGKRVSSGRREQIQIVANATGNGTYLEIADDYVAYLNANNYEETGNIVTPWGTSVSSTRKLVGKDMVRIQLDANNDESGKDQHNNSHKWWRCTATYEPPRRGSRREEDSRKTRLAIGEYTFNTDTTGGTSNVKYALEVSDSAGNSHFNAYPAGAKKLVGWTGGGVDDQRIEGADIPTPSLTKVYRVIVAAADFTTTYEKAVSVRTGTINNATWQGFDQGEAIFGGMQHNFLLDADDNEAAELNLTFHFKQNVSALTITGWNNNRDGTADHTVAKPGWYYASKPATTSELNGVMLTLPDGVSVQRLAPLADFNDLLPGAHTWANIELVII